MTSIPFGLDGIPLDLRVPCLGDNCSICWEKRVRAIPGLPASLRRMLLDCGPAGRPYAEVLESATPEQIEAISRTP